MSTNLKNERLNIRIEIENNFIEAMDVDENKSEEEGEIRENFLSTHNKKNEDDLSQFINLEQKKLQDRAIRFSLKPEEINTFSEEDMNELYISLGVTADNIGQIRLESVHLRSSDKLTLKDVSNYFLKYAPNSIEMVDLESYNIVWENKLSAARALSSVSQVVKGMPVRDVEHVMDNFILDDSEAHQKHTFLNENQKIELKDESSEKFKKLMDCNTVDVSVINIPIPPGYWRLGKETIHHYSVLLRFSLVTDKKPQLIEKYNTYNNYLSRGRLFISNRGIFSRNKDITTHATHKDPWGILAKTWNDDYKFREQERYNDELIQNNLPSSILTNPELRVRLTAKRRLGIKQNEETEPSSEKEQSEESDQENIKKISKVPRMRMYADEEEEKIKRKKLLHILQRQSEKIQATQISNTDLRNILGVTNKKIKICHEWSNESDLSANLRNRRNKQFFTLAQDNKPNLGDLTSSYSEKDVINDRKPKSPVHLTAVSHRKVDRSGRPQSREYQRSINRKHIGNMYVGGLYSTREDIGQFSSHKPRSKVALVIKTQKKPSVASAVSSRNYHYDTSSSGEDNSSSENSVSEDSSSSNNSKRRHKHQSPQKKKIQFFMYKRKKKLSKEINKNSLTNLVF